MISQGAMVKKTCNHLHSLLSLAHLVKVSSGINIIQKTGLYMENTPQAPHCDAQIGGLLIWGKCHGPV